MAGLGGLPSFAIPPDRIGPWPDRGKAPMVIAAPGHRSGGRLRCCPGVPRPRALRAPGEERRLMAEPVMLEVRERRSPFGRFCKWAFWIFQAAMLLLMLGTCAAVTPFLTGPDPEVAMGAGMFGAMALGTLWTVWPVGTVFLGLLALLTRGRKRLIPAPAEDQAPTARQAGTPASRRSGGSVPETGRRD